MARSFPLKIQEPSGTGKPWVVLIHGLGLSDRSWVDPFGESLLDGAIPFDYVLTDPPSSLRPPHFPGAAVLGFSPPLRLSQTPPLSLWELLKREGYGILAWSQGNPRGRVENAAGELQAVLEELPSREKSVLLGHSRGGLVARKYLQDRRPGWERVSTVILLGAPNHGSRLANLAALLGRSPLSFLFGDGMNPPSPIRGKSQSGRAVLLLRNLARYSGGEGIEEMAPRSVFMRRLAAGEGGERKNNIPYFNLVGTRTDFIRIYLRSSRIGRAKPVISLFDGLERFLPRALVPMEIRQGRGDGQVSVRSARLPWAEKNLLLPVNHAQFLVNPEVQVEIRNILKTI